MFLFDWLSAKISFIFDMMNVWNNVMALGNLGKFRRPIIRHAMLGLVTNPANALAE